MSPDYELGLQRILDGLEVFVAGRAPQGQGG